MYIQALGLLWRMRWLPVFNVVRESAHVRLLPTNVLKTYSKAEVSTKRLSQCLFNYYFR
jgi:hypothetical protein